MTEDQAKAVVIAKYPQASCLPVYSVVMATHQYVIIDGTRYGGRWLTNKHRTAKASWLRAAENVRKGVA